MNPDNHADAPPATISVEGMVAATAAAIDAASPAAAGAPTIAVGGQATSGAPRAGLQPIADAAEGCGHGAVLVVPPTSPTAGTTPPQPAHAPAAPSTAPTDTSVNVDANGDSGTSPGGPSCPHHHSTAPSSTAAASTPASSFRAATRSKRCPRSPFSMVKPTVLTPVDRLGVGGWVWLIALQGVMAIIINAGINFGLHVPLYLGKEPIRLWHFPNTLAGDLGVTLLVQSVLTYIIGSRLQWSDLWYHRVTPWNRAPPGDPTTLPCAACRARPTSRAARCFLWFTTIQDWWYWDTTAPLVRGDEDTIVARAVRASSPTGFTFAPGFGRPSRATVAPEPKPDLSPSPPAASHTPSPPGPAPQPPRGLTTLSNPARPAALVSPAPLRTRSAAAARMVAALPLRTRCCRCGTVVCRTALKGLVFAVCAFLILWPIAVGILAGVWGNDGYNDFPLPQVIMAVYPGVLGLLNGAWLAWCTLHSAARLHKISDAVVFRSPTRRGAGATPAASDGAGGAPSAVSPPPVPPPSHPAAPLRVMAVVDT